MKSNYLFLIASILIIILLTWSVKISSPGYGYFNFGNIGVTFAGLQLGPAEGFIAAAIGSALGDYTNGYLFIAPLTFFAKGFEAVFYGFVPKMTFYKKLLFAMCGAICMVGVYFIGEVLFYPEINTSGALSDLKSNIVQAIGGGIGGFLLYQIQRALRKLIHKRV